MNKTTKILLGAIALGLWANAVPHIIRPAQAYATAYCTGQDDKMR